MSPKPTLACSFLISFQFNFRSLAPARRSPYSAPNENIEFSLFLSLFFVNSILVPPNIDDSLSSSDVIVREGSNVTLRCRASGSPTPVVKWKRDSMEKIAINKSLVGKSHTPNNK